MASYNFPHSPGTFLQSVTMAAQTIGAGMKTAVILGEVDIAFKAPTLGVPVYVDSLAALSAAFDLDSEACLSVVNPLFETASKHLLAGGGACYVIPVGPVGTMLTTPALITTGNDKCEAVDNYTHAAPTNALTAGAWKVCITEYISATDLTLKGETLASPPQSLTVAASPSGVGNVTAIHIKHTTTQSATGMKVYVQGPGNNYWWLVDDVAYQASVGESYVIELPDSTDEATLPSRNEGLVSQTAASLDDVTNSWQSALDGAKGLFDVSCVTVAGGYNANGSPSQADNLTLMNMAAQHCEQMAEEAYNKRLAIVPAIVGETHVQRMDDSKYGVVGAETYPYITSDRLLKVGFNGTEGYVSGAFCNRTWMQGITYFPLPMCQPSELFQGGNAYPLSAADRDGEYAMGWTLLKPFEDGVRIMRGVTSNAAAATPTVFVELFVRTVMDYLFGEFERHGDAFIGSGVGIQSQEMRMSLEADFRGVLLAMQTAGAIQAFDVLVVPNGDGMANAVDVALSVTVSHEIEQIFIYATISGG